MRDGPVLDDAPVHEDVLGSANRPLIAEGRDVAVNLEPSGFLPQLDQVEPLPEELKEALARTIRGRTLEELSSTAAQRETDLRIPQRHLRDEAGDLRGLRGVRLEKLAARRKVVEQIGDLDRRAFRRADLPLGRDRAAVDPYFRAGRAPARARAQHEMRHRRDARQRLAAEAERSNRTEVFRARDLACRMTLDRQTRILRIHPLAVVLDAQQFLAAELDRDDDARRAGIERVLDQFLDDRGGTLDHFTGGDLIRQVHGEPVNTSHGYG